MKIRLRYDFMTSSGNPVPDGYSFTCQNSSEATPLEPSSSDNSLFIGDTDSSYVLTPVKVNFYLPDNLSNAVVKLSRKLYAMSSAYTLSYKLSKLSDGSILDSKNVTTSGTESSPTTKEVSTVFTSNDSLVVDITYPSTSSKHQGGVIYQYFYVEADYDFFDISFIGYNDNTSLQFNFKDTDFFTFDKVEILGLSEVVTVTDFSKPVEVGSLLSDGRVTTGITYKIYYTNKAGVSYSTEITDSYIIKKYLPLSINAPSLLPTNSSLSSLVERLNDIDNIVDDISESLSGMLVFYGGSVGDKNINTLIKNISILLSELPVKN